VRTRTTRGPGNVWKRTGHPVCGINPAKGATQPNPMSAAGRRRGKDPIVRPGCEGPSGQRVAEHRAEGTATVHDPRLGRRNKAETLESGRIVRERDRPVPPGPPARRSERRREPGHARIASYRQTDGGAGGTAKAASYEPRPHVRHVERPRLAPPTAKNRTGEVPPMRSAPEAARVGGDETPKRDRPSAWQHRAARVAVGTC